MHNIFLIKNDKTSHYVDLFLERYPYAQVVAGKSYYDIAKMSLTKDFFVVTEVNEDVLNCDFSNFGHYNHDYPSDAFDDNFSIRLYDKNFLKKKLGSPNIFYHNGILRNDFDIVMLSYNEPEADKHYENLVKKSKSSVKRVDGVKGIPEAHRQAANVAETDLFYVVDADACIVNGFDFSSVPNEFNLDYLKETVYVWRSINPVNDLSYGYGGVKLFPKDLILSQTELSVDFTTSVAKHFIPVNNVSNITAFNTDPFNTWKSAFRECAKLATNIIKNSNQEETKARLETWLTVGEDRPFGSYALRGAKEGAEFGKSNKDLSLINDFEWLRKRFEGSV